MINLDDSKIPVYKDVRNVVLELKFTFFIEFGS